jgi:hypothetical protein
MYTPRVPAVETGDDLSTRHVILELTGHRIGDALPLKSQVTCVRECVIKRSQGVGNKLLTKEFEDVRPLRSPNEKRP